MSDVEKGSVNDPSTLESIGFRSNVVPAYHNSKKATIANGGPLGLFAFASTTLILSFYNTNVRGIHTPNIVVGMAIFHGGLVQILVGMWCFPRGDTFGATTFTSYGAFWLSFATIYIPGSGIAEAYAGKDPQMRNAVGTYLMTWMTVTILFLITSLRKSVANIVLFGVLTITLMCLGISDLTGRAILGRVGGVLGIITALIAYYIGLSELLEAEKKAVVQLPLFIFKHD